MNLEHLTDSDLMDLIGLYDEEPSTWHAMLRQVAEKEMERRHGSQGNVVGRKVKK